MKPFNGKAIYNPSGKAAEYSQWACNFYVGCSNGCKYCYCKKGILAPVMGMDKPQLKKCFKDENHALGVFTKELMLNANSIREHGLFFTFTSDPMLHETKSLTLAAIRVCQQIDVPVKLLTKVASLTFEGEIFNSFNKKLIAVGFTLTGHDELEKGASTNQERIEAMRKLHEAGFKIWASIEPIIDFSSSLNMIAISSEFCDLYKIGLKSGDKYGKDILNSFIKSVIITANSSIYFKDSLLKQAGIDRVSLPSNCVSRDYNIFQD